MAEHPALPTAPAQGRQPAVAASFCPGCAYPVGENVQSLVVEYWEADRPVYRLRCASCGWTGDVSPVNPAAVAPKENSP